MQDAYGDGCNDVAVAQVGFFSSSNDGFLSRPAKPRRICGLPIAQRTPMFAMPEKSSEA